MKNLVKVFTVSLVALTLILGSVGSVAAGSNKAGYKVAKKTYQSPRQLRLQNRNVGGKTFQSTRQQEFQNHKQTSEAMINDADNTSKVAIAAKKKHYENVRNSLMNQVNVMKEVFPTNIKVTR